MEIDTFSAMDTSASGNNQPVNASQQAARGGMLLQEGAGATVNSGDDGWRLPVETCGVEKTKEGTASETDDVRPVSQGTLQRPKHSRIAAAGIGAKQGRLGWGGR